MTLSDLPILLAVCGVVVGLIAFLRGRNPVGWAVYGFLLPPVALIHLLISQNVTEDATPTTRAPCPFCAEAVLKAAEVCPHCQRDLPENWVAQASKDSTAGMEY
jgi:hypothetical protein